MHKIQSLFFIVLLSLVSSCQNQKLSTLNDTINIQKKEHYDATRLREIPVAVITSKKQNKIPIIFSHGWGKNKGGDYLVYSYLTDFLAQQGYFVASIQHELPTDEFLAMKGDFKVTRMPNWKRGAENIYFTIQQLKNDFPYLKFDKLIIIGHSNGGDMSTLFAHQHPELLEKLITLDQRRMTLPRTSKPKIYTIRSQDYPADEGVLPTEEEIKKYKITIDWAPINHSQIDNDATPNERKYMTSKILTFLQDSTK